MINECLIRDIVEPYKKLYGKYYYKQLLSSRDIDLIEMPMGKDKNSLKGMIAKNCRMKTVVLNSDLDDIGQLIVVVHEFGHDVCGHLKGRGVTRLCDFNFSYRHDFSRIGVMENEANYIVADYVLDDDETLEVIYSFDMKAAASMLKVPVEILDLKMRLLAKRGKIQDYNRSSDF